MWRLMPPKNEHIELFTFIAIVSRAAWFLGCHLVAIVVRHANKNDTQIEYHQQQHSTSNNIGNSHTKRLQHKT